MNISSKFHRHQTNHSHLQFESRKRCDQLEKELEAKLKEAEESERKFVSLLERFIPPPSDTWKKASALGNCDDDIQRKKDRNPSPI